MKEIEKQISLDEVSDEYKNFISKFKPKKTTDDCYTPENIYNAVKDWAVKEYGINPEHIVRPFYPGGDYERFEYTEQSVVLDNPPFSIISQICKYYIAREIPFFLFAPHLTNLGICGQNKEVTHIIVDTKITYENGAVVNTAFVTNLDKWLIRSAPDLHEAIKRENQKNKKATKAELPKYQYPPTLSQPQWSEGWQTRG